MTPGDGILLLLIGLAPLLATPRPRQWLADRLEAGPAGRSVEIRVLATVLGLVAIAAVALAMHALSSSATHTPPSALGSVRHSVLGVWALEFALFVAAVSRLMFGVVMPGGARAQTDRDEAWASRLEGRVLAEWDALLDRRDLADEIRVGLLGRACRVFFVERFQLLDLPTTTDEVLAGLGRRPTWSAEQAKVLGRLLRRVDRVVFAGHQAGSQLITDLDDDFRVLVRSVRPPRPAPARPLVSSATLARL